MKRLLLILFLFPSLLFAQSNLPLNREFGLNLEKFLSYNTEIKDSIIQGEPGKEIKTVIYHETPASPFKPYILPQHNHIDKYDPKRKATSVWKRKIKQESLFIINDTADKFYMTIDPLLNFQYGKDLADTTGEKLITNTRGFVIRGDLGKKVSFESSFYENQSTFPDYLDTSIAHSNKLFPQSGKFDYNVIPGQGRSKPFKSKGYDYAMASGYVSYSPFKFLNLQVGNGKHFVGDGYRSLLLSDNAFNYPYARITTVFENIQYTNLYTSFMNLTDGGVKTPPHTERLFQKKIGSFQMLSFNFFHRLQLGLFQGMIWEAADSSNRQHVEFNTFDPVIGVNAATYGLHNKNNVLLGATLKLEITNSISIYGQYMLDDVYSKGTTAINNKYGYQAGLKYFNLFTVKNLHLQLEYNSVRPYAYSASNPQQSYTHYNQALAHPLGANFNEAIGFINYKFKDFFIEIKGIYAIKGADSSSFNYGGNIFKSDNSIGVNQTVGTVATTQGVKNTIITEDIHIGYLVNPSTNLNIVVGVMNRSDVTDKLTSNTRWVYVGIRTSLANIYYDF